MWKLIAQKASKFIALFGLSKNGPKQKITRGFAMEKFISPNINMFRSYTELQEFEKSVHYFSIQDKTQVKLLDIYELKRVIVLAEPGLGKTRLLQEIVTQAKTNDRKAIFISLKKSRGNLCEYIIENTKKPDNFANINKDVFTSEVFQLSNCDTIIVCLDALDEVQVLDVSNIIDGIKEFNKQYPRVTIVVSCRRNYYDQYASVLTDDTFAFLTLSVFSQNQVEQYLKDAGIDVQKVKELTSKLRFKNRDLILQVPRYLCMLPATLAKFPDTNHLRKSDLFREFTYFKIETENTKQDKEFSQKINLIKRVLEKVALIMEIQQSNLLKKEDLMTLFDDIKSNLCITFLSQVDVSVLYERSLLRDNFDGTVQFESTEIQEYLAAVEISRLGHLYQVVFDFTVEPELLEIYPSWFNTLSFMVEIDPTIVLQLAQLARNKIDKLQSEDFHKLITSVPELMPLEHAIEVFNQIFEYYQNKSVPLSLGIAKNLANFPIKHSQIVIKENLDETQLTSIARFAGYRGRYNAEELTKWKELLLKLAESASESLIEEIIFAFGLMNDMESLSAIAEPVLSPKNKSATQNIVAACISANPNHPFAIKAFVEGTKQDDISARYGIYDITDVMSLKMLFDYLVDDEKFRIKFIEDETIFHDTDKILLSKIENLWDNDFEQKLIAVIIASIKSDELWQVEKSVIIVNMVEIARKKDPNFVLRLIDALISPDVVDAAMESWYYIPKFLGLATTKGLVGEIFAKLAGIEKGKDILLQALQYVNSLQSPESKEIYKEGRPYFQNEYAELEKRPKDPAKKELDARSTLSKFLFKAHPEPGKFMEDVFHYFWQNRELLVPLLSPNDFARLSELIVGSVLEVFDLETTTLTIDKEEGNSRTYTTSTSVNRFKDCLRIIGEYNSLLKIDLEHYRSKFVGYIPFAYPEDLAIIFNIISELTAKDIEDLLKVYMDERKDDLGYFAPGNLSTICRHYKIHAVASLKKMVEDDQIALYTRQDALETLVELSVDKQLLQELFEKYSLTLHPPTYLLAEIANAAIIKHFDDIDAVKWRVKELVRRKFKFTRLEGAHTVGSHEHELLSKDFARPIMELRSPRYEEIMVGLADNAVEIYQEDVGYREYGLYLWQIVCVYFGNLKETKSYRYLLNLIKHIETNYGQYKAYMLLCYDLNNLKFNYLQYLGHPNDFATCIKRYNDVKEKQYLDIFSSEDLVELGSASEP